MKKWGMGEVNICQMDTDQGPSPIPAEVGEQSFDFNAYRIKAKTDRERSVLFKPKRLLLK